MKTTINQQFAMRAAQLLTIVLTFGGSVSAQYWEQLPDAPVPLYGAYATVYDVSGGMIDPMTSSPNDSLQHFSDSSPTPYWSNALALAPPLSRVGAFSCVHGINPFVIGGMTYDSTIHYNDLWRRDFGMPWAALSPLPAQGRAWAAGVVLNDTLYYGLGNNNAPNDWWAYSFATDTWVSCAPFPGGARQGASCFTVNNKVYVGLGSSQLSDTAATFHSDWYRYDPVNDTWSTIPTMPGLARMQAVSFTHDDIGYVFCGGGWDQGAKSLLRDGYAYDWLNNQWLTLSLFPGESMMGGVATYNANSPYGPCAYLGTGGTEINGPGWTPTETSGQWWRYVPGGIAGIEDLRESNTFFARTNGNELIATWSPCEGNVELRLADALGRQLHAPIRFSGPVGTAILPIAGMASGVVLVEWRAPDQRAVRRVVVE